MKVIQKLANKLDYASAAQHGWACLSVFLAALVLLIALPACTGKYQRTPVSVPFNLHQPDVKTEILIRIGKEDNYAFTLHFIPKDRQDRRKISALLEGKDAYGRSTHGEKTPVGIEVYTLKDGQNLFISHGGGESFPLYGASSEGNYRKLIYNDYLMTGDYRVVIDTKAGNPKFKDIEVKLHIGKAHRPK